MPEMRISERFMQSSENGHSQPPAYRLGGNSDHQHPDGLQRASRYCLERDDKINRMKKC